MNSPSRQKKQSNSPFNLSNVRKQMTKDFGGSVPESYQSLRLKYFGKKGIITLVLRSIGSLPSSRRAKTGQEINVLKEEVEDRLRRLHETESMAKKGSAFVDAIFDCTAPFSPNTPNIDKPRFVDRKGSLHPLTSVGEKAIRIFESMGFHVTESRRLDDDYNVFTALNFPEGHPARDMYDTFWTDTGLIPITHTSSMQNRIIRSVEPPIREIIVGKCFRHEATDASHEHTFYQLEGVYVDKGVTLADLIGTLSSFMNAFYGRTVKYRIQPSYFPFVEPGLEFLIECLVCGQKGCPFCHYSSWVEVVPCGPIHPNVFSEAGRDPSKYSGFAWGLGFDRLVILRNQISDIRHLHGGDLRFLEQFS